MDNPTQIPKDEPIIIDLTLSREILFLIALALLAATLLGYLALSHREASASSPSAPAAAPYTLRKYYLTSASTYNGNDPLTACDTGFHFASLWELLDTSNLEYDARGATHDDSGDGPPSDLSGWIRTGYQAVNDSGVSVPGQCNCNAWTDGTSTNNGTVAKLPSDWTDAGFQDVHVWDTLFTGCNNTKRVWCIED
jgi:hypothetical protein